MRTQNKIAKFIITISLYKQTSMDLAAYETRIIRKAPLFPAHQAHRKRAELFFSTEQQSKLLSLYWFSLDITNSELSFILFFLTKTSDKPRRKMDKGESNQFIYI